MFLAGSVFEKFDTRISALEEINLEDRLSQAEDDITSLTTRVGSLETWRSSKATAISNETAMMVSTTINTAIITLGLQAPIASSIESNINTVKTEINNVKTKVNSIISALRSREIINV